jgi:hypothetical protein
MPSIYVVLMLVLFFIAITVKSEETFFKGNLKNLKKYYKLFGWLKGDGGGNPSARKTKYNRYANGRVDVVRQ